MSEDTPGTTKKISDSTINADYIRPDRICPGILNNHRRGDGSFIVASYLHPEKTMEFLAGTGVKATIRNDVVISCLNITFEDEETAQRFERECCVRLVPIGLEGYGHE